MAAWLAPATFSASATLTAAQLNAEVRDHCIWLKAALDLVTDNSAADSGDATYIWIKRTATTSGAILSGVTGDTQPRFRVYADGKVEFGPGGVTAPDTNVYRLSAGVLKTDGALQVAGNFSHLGSYFGVYGTAATTKKTVTGSRGANAALASLLTQLAAYGLITDSTTA